MPLQVESRPADLKAASAKDLADAKSKAPQRDSYSVTFVWPNGRERTITVRADQHIWDAAHYNGIDLPALCHQGWCLTCAGHLEANGEVDQRDSVAVFPQDRKAGYALLCTGKACSDLRIRVEQARAMRTHRQKCGLPAPYADV